MKTLNDILMAIDTFLTDPKVSYSAQRGLWDVLTALRGPDSNNAKVKMKTTARIRSAAFPLTATSGNAPAEFSRSRAKVKPLTGKERTANTTHFSNHINSAVSALRRITRKV